MSTIIKFDVKELKTLAKDKDSCVVEKNVTKNFALQPWCLGNLKESVKNLLDYKIGKFDKEFEGIFLSYKNLRVCNIGSIRNDSANIQFQIQADYFIFQPYVGAVLRGKVNKKSQTHLGLLVHRVFNVVIPRPTDQPGDEWIGTSVQEGQVITFKIVVLDLFGALPYIRGEIIESLLEENFEETSTNEYQSVSYIKFDKIKPSFNTHEVDTTEETTKKSKRKSKNQEVSEEDTAPPKKIKKKKT